MKNLVVFVDLFSLLAIALFVAFAVSVGSGGAHDEIERPVVIELYPRLLSDAGDTDASGELRYSAKLYSNEAPETALRDVIVDEQRAEGVVRYIIRDAPDRAFLEVVVSKIEPAAFDYRWHQLTASRIYPSATEIAFEREPVGAAATYRVPLQ